MDDKQLNITSFSLIIFDECHHCYGGHSFYKTLIPYHDLKQDEENEHILPQVQALLGWIFNLSLKIVCKRPECLQIVGFTASIGIGKAKSKGQAIDHIRTMMANLDADELVSVKENIAELADKMNSPDQCMNLLQFLMNDTIFREIVCITTFSDF